MPWFDRFTRRWAQAGVVAEPTTQQADQGFAYLGQNPPTVEQFNALFQILDDKDGYLYRQYAGVLARAGMSPAQTGDNQLADAIRAMRSLAPTVFATTGTSDYVVPSTIARVLVFCTGGGGGATGCDSRVATGASGGGAGTAIGFYNVTPGARVAVTVGPGGGAGGYVGGDGGSSSFGTFCSALGGRGGVFDNANSLAGGLGGTASGGLINLRGGDGSDGHPTLVFVQGRSGGSFWGGSRRSGFSRDGANGGQGLTPGAGGSAPYFLPIGVAAVGAAGAAGVVVVVPVA